MLAPNDSGVDSSNDSNDNAAVSTKNSDLENMFENQNVFGKIFFPPGTFDTNRQIQYSSSCSSSLKIRRKNRLRYAYSDVLSYSRESKERKLRLAASTCNTELVRKLLMNGTNPNCCDEHKRSPLHLAACRGYWEIVAELLQFEANPNIVDSLGNTPLHLSVISASSSNFHRVVKLLLQAGASVHMLDRNGKNPLELAESKLRLMRSRHVSPTPETAKTLEDMCLLIAMILKYFCKQKEDIDNLAALEERLQNLSTNDSVATEADTLLASVELLSINK